MDPYKDFLFDPVSGIPRPRTIDDIFRQSLLTDRYKEVAAAAHGLSEREKAARNLQKGDKTRSADLGAAAAATLPDPAATLPAPDLATADLPAPDLVTAPPPEDTPIPPARGSIRAEDVPDAKVSGNPMNFLQKYAAEKFGLDEDQRSDLGRALMVGGLATMAGDSPYAAQNIGKGALTGVEAYYGAGDARRQADIEDEARLMEREMFELKKQQIAQELRQGRISEQTARTKLERLNAQAAVSPYEGFTSAQEGKLRVAEMLAGGDEAVYRDLVTRLFGAEDDGLGV